MKVNLGIDIGTTHIKAVAVDRAGTTRFRMSASPRLHSVGEGGFEQDPEEIEQIVQNMISTCSTQWTVERVAFSAAMHSFMVVTPAGEPLTRSWTWQDQRARAQAQQVRRAGLSKKWYELTGCPVHAMSPAVKWLAWAQERNSAAGMPVALKDWLYFRLTGIWCTDFATASASGLAGLDGRWRADMLRELRIDPARLPSIHDLATTHSRYVLGATDGAMSHYALQVWGQSREAVLSWGTSAAIRTNRLAVQDLRFSRTGSFAYFWGPGYGYLVGQALSNAGNVLQWISRICQVSPAEAVAQGLAMLESGQSLPFFLPFLFGERSPYWNESLRAGFLKIDARHQNGHLLAAVVLGLLGLLKGAYERLQETCGPLAAVRVGSSLAQQRPWGQAIADVLGSALEQSIPDDASAWGAAMLAAGGSRPPEPLPHAVIEPQGARWVHRVAEYLEELQAMAPTGVDG